MVENISITVHRITVAFSIILSLIIVYNFYTRGFDEGVKLTHPIFELVVMALISLTVILTNYFFKYLVSAFGCLAIFLLSITKIYIYIIDMQEIGAIDSLFSKGSLINTIVIFGLCTWYIFSSIILFIAAKSEYEKSKV